MIFHCARSISKSLNRHQYSSLTNNSKTLNFSSNNNPHTRHPNRIQRILSPLPLLHVPRTQTSKSKDLPVINNSLEVLGQQFRGIAMRTRYQWGLQERRHPNWISNQNIRNCTKNSREINKVATLAMFQWIRLEMLKPTEREQAVSMKVLVPHSRMGGLPIQRSSWQSSSLKPWDLASSITSINLSFLTVNPSTLTRTTWIRHRTHKRYKLFLQLGVFLALTTVKLNNNAQLRGSRRENYQEWPKRVHRLCPWEPQQPPLPILIKLTIISLLTRRQTIWRGSRIN